MHDKFRMTEGPLEPQAQVEGTAMGLSRDQCAREPASRVARSEAEMHEQQAICFRLLEKASMNLRGVEEEAWNEIVRRVRESFNGYR